MIDSIDGVVEVGKAVKSISVVRTICLSIWKGDR